MTTTAATTVERLEQDGYAIVEDVLSLEQVQRLIEALATVELSGRAASGRNVFAQAPAALEVLSLPTVKGLIAGCFGQEWFAVRSILFDKVPGANWYVGWHQDQCIAVRERADVPGFGPWSVKDGVPHVEPPAGLLERMVTLRLHLDDCGEENGPLKVVPGSHRHGRLTPEGTKALRESNGVATCTVGRGGAVLMKPLTLHASRPAKSPNHRRVLHIECAAEELPAPLQWQERRRFKYRG